MELNSLSRYYIVEAIAASNRVSNPAGRGGVNPVTPGRGGKESGQAMTEYLLVFAVVALSVAAALGLLRAPLAAYFDRIAAVVAQAR